MPSSHWTNLLVVGAGPAGLAAAAACRARGHDFLVIELGMRIAQRDHDDQRRLGTGVGGSGLYSDGKFSFFPSATALWRLQNRRCLRESWSWFASRLSDQGLAAPGLPQSDQQHSTAPGREGLARKEYPSSYMHYLDRERMIRALEQDCGESLLAPSELRHLVYDEATHRFRCDVHPLGMVEARTVIYAGGRFGPLNWSRVFPAGRQVFRRVEVGVRLEQDSRAFFLRDDQSLDPKLTLASTDRRAGWRTFCCCRDGEIVTTEVLGIVSVSGRADCLPTGRSNVGFNLRITDSELAQRLWPKGLAAPQGGQRSGVQPLDEYLHGGCASGPLAEVLGVEPSRLLCEGLGRLRAAYPRLDDSSCLVVGPAIEGIGFYPDMHGDLRLAPYPCWIAGDATGIFRGLTAAMVSGYQAALQAIEYLEGE